ncbi:MAG TPA: hypothetical protein PK640_00640 [Verrucomicrobiota bacterium]|nr:hypothetical protein [Verrucomicrobiota bacterium]
MKTLIVIHTLVVGALVCAAPRTVGQPWMKVTPPPDVDKTYPTNPDYSCSLATAANMLAGAGYGNGPTIQARAEDIYGNMTANFGTLRGRWIDTCLNWWLESSHNTQCISNAYQVVTVHGGTDCSVPLANPYLPRAVGNALRQCSYVGYVIWWPLCAPWACCNGGHSVTVWGDHGEAGTLTDNPATVVIADSDADMGGDVSAYVWDAYHDPAAVCRFGDGWHIPYYSDNLDPYVIQWVELSATEVPTHCTNSTQTVVHSKQVHQNDLDERPASDLHFTVGSDVPLLSYRVEVDFATNTAPAIEPIWTEGECRAIDVDVTFDAPVPYCTWVTITATFVEPDWNSITYSNLHFTFRDGEPGAAQPALKWKIETPPQPEPVSNQTGGCVVGSFTVWSLDGEQLSNDRIQHEYEWDQDPEAHTVVFENLSVEGCIVRDLRFGHSYGLLDQGDLWAFSTWMTVVASEYVLMPGDPITLDLDWEGRLPYPPAPGPFPKLTMLSIQRGAAGTVEISWTGPGTLQEASGLAGPWTDTALQQNPQSVVASGESRFFRILAR